MRAGWERTSQVACNITVGIPTVGRASILRETLLELTRQTRPADAIMVCGATAADVEGADAFSGVQVLLAEPGLPRQRNALVAAAADATIMVFFDDDFLPDPGYLAAIERHMAGDAQVVVATGRVLADGIGGPGISPAAGRAIILAQGAGGDAGLTPAFSGYGCNMAVRLDTMRQHSLQFDERLPLYGWQEDVDLSRRMAAFGTVVKVEAACGVHLGVKLGRGSGVRLGYSQVANPLYLAHKRAGYPFGRAVEHMTRNIAMNTARALWPEPHVDRRGRLRGNFLALTDLSIAA